MEGQEDVYAAREAARVLRRSHRRVLQMLEQGDLEGYKDESGRWMIPQRAVHELLPTRPTRSNVAPPADGTPATRERAQEATLGGSEAQSRVEALSRELGRMEGRLELTEVAETTLRESLDRERERADAERERAEALEIEARDLRAQLEEVHRSSWWRRFFGFKKK